MFRVEMKFEKTTVVMYIEDIYDENDYIYPIIQLISMRNDPMKIQEVIIYDVKENKEYTNMSDFIINKFRTVTKNITSLCKNYYEDKILNN